jgi:hypothetical protein
MFTLFKKIFLANILVWVVLAAGAGRGSSVALAQSQKADIPETPLYPGLTWNDLGPSSRDIRVNVKGDSISLSGEA